MRCLLVGNYGDGNVGDEALRAYFLTCFSEIEWTVVSARPQSGEAPRLPSGIRSFLSFSWLRSFAAFRDCDAVVFGGGSLFTDVESIRACILWWLHAAVARLYRRPLFLAFQGIGPFRTRLGERLGRQACTWATWICVRDEESAKRVETWGMSTKLVRSFDPVFLLPLNKKAEVSTQKIFMVIPRAKTGAYFRPAFIDCLQKTAYDKIIILSLQPEHEGEVCRRLAAIAPDKTIIRKLATLGQLGDSVSEASFVLTERYHGAVAAIAAGVPVRIEPVAVGDKLWDLRRSLEQEGASALLEKAGRGAKALRDVLAKMDQSIPHHWGRAGMMRLP